MDRVTVIDGFYAGQTGLVVEERERIIPYGSGALYGQELRHEVLVRLDQSPPREACEARVADVMDVWVRSGWVRRSEKP